MCGREPASQSPNSAFLACFWGRLKPMEIGLWGWILDFQSVITLAWRQKRFFFVCLASDLKTSFRAPFPLGQITLSVSRKFILIKGLRLYNIKFLQTFHTDWRLGGARYFDFFKPVPASILHDFIKTNFPITLFESRLLAIFWSDLVFSNEFFMSSYR